MNILDVCIMYYFDRCLIFTGTCDPTSNPYLHRYVVNILTSGYGVAWRVIFCCCEYGYEIVIPDVYLPIAISMWMRCLCKCMWAVRNGISLRLSPESYPYAYPYLNYTLQTIQSTIQLCFLWWVDYGILHLYGHYKHYFASFLL